MVLDCFSGSGTTAIACLNNNRDFIGCEIIEEYYSKSLERIEKEGIIAKWQIEAKEK